MRLRDITAIKITVDHTPLPARLDDKPSVSCCETPKHGREVQTIDDGRKLAVLGGIIMEIFLLTQPHRLWSGE